MIPSETLAAYNQSRPLGTDVSVLCHAPFVSLNFDQTGRITACCYNREYVLGCYPAQSVQEIWTGAPATALRDAFVRGAVVSGCDGCFDQLRMGNFAGALMRNFDAFSAGRAPRRDAAVGLPLVLEFEISNTCSLECLMCGGHWSSAIRERRERLPPLRSPYDRAFVQQIEALLPAVVVARFLGGEPFLIPQYHEIWTSMRRLSPQAELSVTTSAAVVPARPRRLLEDLRAHIVISLDGITATTYESIRRNARFDQVMANLEDFLAYTRRQGTTLTVACCPMVHNWFELVPLVDYCEQRGIRVFFNMVLAPVESSLAGLSEPRLAHVAATLEREAQPRLAAWTAQSQDQWRGLMNLLRGWLDEKRALGWVRATPTDTGGRDGAERGARRPPAPLRESTRELRAALDDRLTRLTPLDAGDVDPKLRTYVDCLLVEHTSATWRSMENGAAGSYEATGGVSSESDVDLALEATRVFVEVVRPDDHARMSSRLAAIRAVSGDRAHVLLRDVYQVYWLLIKASDQTFAEQVAEHFGR